MKFCCEGFQLAVENINKKGLSISSQLNPQGSLAVSLVFRSNNADEDKVFSRLLELAKYSNEDIEFYSGIERVILYCPWCGKKLSSKYKNAF